MSLRDTCPEVEVVIRDLGSFPEAAPADAARARVAQLSDAGDTETQNALAGLVDALSAMAVAQPGDQYVDADRALISSLDNLADRCKAVGSSALQ